MAIGPDDDAVTTASDEMLSPSEATDSDELRNDDGDELVTAPDHWQGADGVLLPDEVADGESLDDKLAAERPDAVDVDPLQKLDEDVEVRRHHGQVSGSPEDGDSFFDEE